MTDLHRSALGRGILQYHYQIGDGGWPLPQGVSDPAADSPFAQLVQSVPNNFRLPPSAIAAVAKGGKPPRSCDGRLAPG